MRTIILSIFIISVQVFSFSQNEKINISEDIKLIKLSDHAYIHVSYTTLPKYGRVSANGLIIIDNNQAFLFDSPWDNQQIEDLYNFLTDSMQVELVGFIPNHWHEDCMGGLEFLQKKKVKSYANQMTIDIASAKKLPIPVHGFTDSLNLQLGNLSIHCYYLGAAHSMDNVVAWIPEEQILFPGCIIKSLNSKNLGNTADGNTEIYPETVKNIISKFPNAKIVIPGHGKYGNKELLEHTKELATR